MSAESFGIALLLGSFLALMLLRVPVAFTLGLSSVLTAVYLDLPLVLISQRMVSGLHSFSFLAVSFFILIRNIMTGGGICDRLIRFVDVLVGRCRGGMAQCNDEGIQPRQVCRIADCIRIVTIVFGSTETTLQFPVYWCSGSFKFCFVPRLVN